MARLVPVSRLAPSSVSRNLPERLDAPDDHQEVVAAEREHGIDQIVPRALLAEMHLEPVGEEGEKIEAVCRLHRFHDIARDRSLARRLRVRQQICLRVGVVNIDSPARCG